MNFSNYAHALVALGQSLQQSGLAWGTSGNISIRIDDMRFLISASGSRLCELSPLQTSLCHLHSANTEGRCRPSIEHPMHRAIYRTRRDAGVVIHVSPPSATLVACSDLEIPADLNVESVMYLGRVTRIPFLQPGSEALASAVEQAAAENDVIILSNHGILLHHQTAPDALMRAESVEMVCRLMLMARSAGVELNRLDFKTVRSLQHAYGR